MLIKNITIDINTSNTGLSQIEYGFIATFINVNMLRYGFTLWMRIQITILTIHIYNMKL